MITRRESSLALLAVITVLGAVAWAQSPAKPAQSSAKPVLKTAVFDWSQIEAQPTKTGVKRQFFDGSTATLNQLECHATTVNPGEATHAPVAQPHDELIIVKDGTLEAQVDGHAQQFGQGSILFQAANDLHGVKNIGTTPATYYVIKIVAASPIKNDSK